MQGCSNPCQGEGLLVGSLGGTVITQQADHQNLQSVTAQVLREMKHVISNFQGFKFSLFKMRLINVARLCAKHFLGLSIYAASSNIIPGSLNGACSIRNCLYLE